MSVISVKNVKKKFRIFYDRSVNLKERVLFAQRNYYEDRWVLKGLSFEVEKGEAIGLVGQNGCGKSTMLKLLSKIMYPDEGSIEIKGRVSSLIELGAGFHPDMSGRENIYTNAAIFGLTRAEIDERLDTIIEFAELGEFIDSPVRIYSSGMYMRLAFSIAVNVDADVLLVDEILAVGDAGFQVKCFNKLQEIKRKGTTIVIVSHSLGAVEQFCDRSYWICDGVIREVGTPREVHPKYLRYMAEKAYQGGSGQKERSDGKTPVAESAPQESAEENIPAEQSEPENQESTAKEANAESAPNVLHSTDTRWISLDAVKVQNVRGEEVPVVASGETVVLTVDYTAKQDIEHVVAGVAVYRKSDGLHCYGSTTKMDGLEEFILKKGKQRMQVTLDNLMLQTGEYSVDWALATATGEQLIYVSETWEFAVYPVTSEAGFIKVPHTWTIG